MYHSYIEQGPTVPLRHAVQSPTSIGDLVTSQERMLEAAIEVIEEHGEAGVRVDEIASMAKVAKPSLYHFFGSRDGLIAAAQAERYRKSLNIGLEEVLQRVLACSSANEFAELVRAWITTFSADDAQHRRSVRLEVLGSSVSRPELRVAVENADEQSNHQLAELAKIAKSRGWALQSPDLDPYDVAAWLHGLWNGRYLAEITEDPERIAAWDQVNMTAVLRLILG
jgi:AcrR family transcriptional regulator